MLQNLHYVKELGLRSQAALEGGDNGQFGELMHEHWEHKKRRSAGISNPQIDEWYALARRNGAIRAAGLEEVRFRFDFEGTKIVFG